MTPVHLIHLDVRAEVPSGERGEIHIRLDFQSSIDRNIEAEVRLVLQPENFRPNTGLERRRKVLLKPGLSSLALIEAVDRPARWETWDRGQPNLYRVSCQILAAGEVLAEASKVTGFRSLRISPAWRWELNGHPFFARGTSLAGKQLQSPDSSPDRVSRNMEFLLAANVNAVRLNGPVVSSEWLDACDRAGLLVWQDLLLTDATPGAAESRAEAASRWRAILLDLTHHPCLALWSLTLPENLSHARQKPAIPLQGLLEADPSRKIVCASTLPASPLPGWHVDDYRNYEKLPESPLVTRFGAQALPCRESLEAILGPGSPLWPPDWKLWARLGFEYDAAFYVARVRPADSLDSLIAATQQYQAELLKFAIERYRLAKHQGVEGIFQHFFLDTSPALSFSVLDCHGRPKLGFKALQLAYQPVLPLFLFQRRLTYSGGRVQGRLAVINDRPNALEGATAEFTLEVEKGTLISWMARLASVPAFGVAVNAILSVTDDFILPSNMTLGPGRFAIRLFDLSGRRIAENIDSLEVVPPPPA